MKDRTPLLSLRGVKKRFDGFEALRGIDLDIYPGEFVSLLGPSGCGKTTTLRLIAGLDSADEGVILLDGQDISNLPPEKRQVNTVFQQLALFPHMNVEKNVGYGLRMRGEKKEKIAKRVQEMLSLVQLSGLEKRMPSQLSGGQQQRVALARALAVGPRVLLLDEPLSALDLHIRRFMNRELKRLQKESGVTFLYITHDQEEAMNMSDRIALMNAGAFVQVGTPQELYDAPATAFAASFIGQSNLLEGTLREADGERGILTIGNADVPCRLRRPASSGEKWFLCLRPERLRCAAAPEGDFALPAVLREHSFVGGVLRSEAELADGRLLILQRQAEEDAPMTPGQPVFISWNPETAPLVPWEEATHEA